MKKLKIGDSVVSIRDHYDGGSGMKGTIAEIDGDGHLWVNFDGIDYKGRRIKGTCIKPVSVSLDGGNSLIHEIASNVYAGTDVMKPPLNSKITLTMDFGLIGEQTVIVEYSAHAAERETRLEPGSPAELEIISATVPELGIDISGKYEVETLYAALKEALE